MNFVSKFLDVLRPFFTNSLIGFIGLDVVVHDFLWVVVMDASPLSIGSRWSSIGFLGFLEFDSIDEFVHNFMSFSEVLSGFIFEVVLSSGNSGVVSSNSSDDFSVELDSVVEVSSDICFHSSFSLSLIGCDSGEKGCNNDSVLFHVGLSFFLIKKDIKKWETLSLKIKKKIGIQWIKSLPEA
jgi:hypothetical protein